jgi:phosphoglycolate phosphatase
MNPQLLIFDLDGTLVDSRADLATAVNLMRAHFGLTPLSLDTVTRFIGNGVRVLVTRALEGTGIDIDQAMAVQRPLYIANLVNQTTLYPGVLEGLDILHSAGHTLAVATNKPIEASNRILDHLGIANLFIAILGGGSVPNLKPHPEMVETLMHKAGIPPRNTWVIGDNYTDLECARNANASSIFVTYGYGTPGAETPTRQVNSFKELLPLFGL